MDPGYNDKTCGQFTNFTVGFSSTCSMATLRAASCSRRQSICFAWKLSLQPIPTLSWCRRIGTASAASLTTALRSVFSDFVDPAIIGNDMTKFWGDALDKFHVARQSLPSNAFFDVEYSDL